MNFNFSTTSSASSPMGGGGGGGFNAPLQQQQQFAQQQQQQQFMQQQHPQQQQQMMSPPMPQLQLVQAAAPHLQQQQLQQQQPFLGLIVPGGVVRTDFVPVVDNSAGGAGGQQQHRKYTLRLDPMRCGDFPGAAPLASVTELVLFLVPPSGSSGGGESVLPPEHGVMCYWQVSTTSTSTAQQQQQQQEQSTGFELLGALTPERPSGAFPTRWSENEQILDATASGRPLLVTIGASIEPLAEIRNARADDAGTSAVSAMASGRLFVAQKIAHDLFTYMQSFDTGQQSHQQMMVVPNNIFERWYRRFEARFRRDPNFFLRDKSS